MQGPRSTRERTRRRTKSRGGQMSEEACEDIAGLLNYFLSCPPCGSRRTRKGSDVDRPGCVCPWAVRDNAR